MLELIKEPWPWYVAGPLIGLMVPILLIMGNRHFGISANLRHICASCLPANIRFFRYEWKKEIWNMVFILGVLIGGIIAASFLITDAPVEVNPKLAAELAGYGITDYSNLVPPQLFNWDTLFTTKGLIMMIGGGFLVGFGTRYAGGCTSGHAIMGISDLQVPSMIATCCFMAGGFIMANFILPSILNL